MCGVIMANWRVGRPLSLACRHSTQIQSARTFDPSKTRTPVGTRLLPAVTILTNGPDGAMANVLCVRSFAVTAAAASCMEGNVPGKVWILMGPRAARGQTWVIVSFSVIQQPSGHRASPSHDAACHRLPDSITWHLFPWIEHVLARDAPS